MLTRPALESLLSARKITTSLEPLFAKDEIDSYQFPATRATCLPLWTILWNLRRETGFSPVLLGDGRSYETTKRFFGEDFAERRAPAALLEEAKRIDGKEWFRMQKDPVHLLEKCRTEISQLSLLQGADTYLEYLREREASLEDHIRNNVIQEPPPIEWSAEGVEPRSSFDVVRRSPYLPQDKRIYVGLIPTINSWEIPAYIPFGGWNACPPPEVHIAVQRYWNQVYGSELVVQTFDTLELKVSHPPTTREQAWALAIEQNEYAEFEQFTLPPLAASLLNASVWYFWWD
jgi:hypothetical protein